MQKRQNPQIVSLRYIITTPSAPFARMSPETIQALARRQI